MKIKDLKNYGIPSYIVNIWEKHYSPYLLPLQEDAVRNYGILDCGGNKEGRMQYAPTRIDSRVRGNDKRGITGLPRRFAPRNDKREDARNDKKGARQDNNNLLVIAPTSSGKSFIGEMAALSQVIHHKKIIYLVPLRSPAEEKYRHFKNLYLLSQTPDGKELPIPFCHSCINDYKKERYNCEQEEVYAERILHLIFEQNEEDKKLYQNKILLKKCKEDEVLSLEEHLSFKKILLLYDWIRGNKNVKTIEQEYNLYRSAIYRLGEGFSWLADSLAAIAENTGWKKKRKEDLNQIKLLALSLSSPPPRRGRTKVGVLLNTNDQRLTTILEIDIHRPDRIIFEGKEVKVTATEFSLIHLLAQHNGQVMSYNELLYELWKDEEDAIYNRVSFHISKIRRTILKTIGENKMNRERLKNIFAVVPKRGVMLNLKTEEMKIN
jgi:DNA-binding winged helix-turn-helix (wHTH) protein